MNEILLKTKLYQPLLRTGIVPRPRLVERLNMGLIQDNTFHRKLTLVSAPAGYGKTTLVAQWLKGTGLPVCWLSLDEADNDPIRFLTYLIAALRHIWNGIGKATEAMHQSPRSSPTDIPLAALVNEIEAVPQPFMLAIDDYHVVHTPAIHQQLTYILDHQPTTLHMVVTTREDPLLPIARLRARGEVQEIRQEDLRFTGDETANFLLNVMGLGLAPEDILALEHRTEGWIAELQLAALSMRGRNDLTGFVQAFSGSSRFILDYLIEEVFERQPPDVKEFLLKTSILEQMSGPLCVALTGRDDSQDLLETLDQINLFIVPLDQSRNWYRYHRLFAELLRHHLRKLGTSQEIGLHAGASQWYEAENMLEDAIHHAIKAKDWDLAGKLISSINDQMLKNGQYITLVGWFRDFPQEFLVSHPRICFDYCWPLLLAGQYENVTPLLTHVEQLAQGNPEFLGEVMAAQAYLARGQGDHPRMVERSQRALALLPKNSVASRGLVAINLGIAYWHMGQMESAEKTLTEALEASQSVGNHYASLTATIFIGRIFAVRGYLKKAEGYFKRALEQGEGIPINCLSYLDLSTLHYEWNNLKESEAYLQKAIILCERNQSEEFQVANAMMQTRLWVALGDLERASEVLENTFEKIQQRNIPIGTTDRVAPLQVHLALAQGDLARAHQLADRLPDNIDAHSFYRFLGLTKAQSFIACGEYAKAGVYLADLYARAKSADLRYGQIAIQILQALASNANESSIQYLVEALTMAQPEGFIRTFVDAGEGLIPLLHEAARRGIAPDYIGKILSALDKRSLKAVTGQSPLIEPLSEREIEVLRLVTAGLSNREIAENLCISPGTAKTHIHNLCGKLGVRNRTEAAMRAKELNLV